MKTTELRTYLITGGWCGSLGTICYLLAAFLPMPDSLSYFVAMLWPLLSIVFLHALYRWLSHGQWSLIAEAGFVFGVVAFALVAAMMSVQLAVRMGFERHAADLAFSHKEVTNLISQTARMVDMGLDVAWDLFIGASLSCLGIAMMSHSLGKKWGIPAVVFGVALVALNVWTFPFPPNTEGLFDIGPLIGIFIIALAVTMLLAGFRETAESR